MKVLLVGNGCSALEYKLGKVIDTEFDFMVAEYIWNKYN